MSVRLVSVNTYIVWDENERRYNIDVGDNKGLGHLYRIEAISEVTLYKYYICKETDYYYFFYDHCGRYRKSSKHGGRVASKTIEDAARNFIYRKRRQIEICSALINRADSAAKKVARKFLGTPTIKNDWKLEDIVNGTYEVKYRDG